MICSKCGADIEDGASICPECGEILDAVNDEVAEAAEAAETETADTAAEEQSPSDEAEKNTDGADDGEFSKHDKLEEIQARRRAKKKREQRKKIFGAAALIVVIIGIAAGGLWVIYDQTQGTEPAPVQTQTPAPSEKAAPAEGIKDAEDNITERTIKAIEIHINEKDEYYIEFELDGARYFALINYGTQEEQIKDKYFIVDAVPADDHMCEGRVPYIINSIVRGGTADGYIIPNSSEIRLTADGVAGYNKKELMVARNEIYARHGRKFESEMLKEYFSNKSWYKPDDNYKDSSLSDIENENANMILKREESMSE